MVTSTPFGSSADVFSWLSGFINLETGQTKMSFRLDRMETLALLAGNPEKFSESIHVAGSKGKGSVTGMISSILCAAGIKTARYASPHVSDFRERLTIGNKYFDESIYIKAGNELKDLVNNLSSSSKTSLFNLAMPLGEEPTFFELVTLWFFLCCRLAKCKVMAVETGMGGRLDATNIIMPLVSVITTIEKEHTEYLGETIEKIAGEKAGIIKPGRPLVLSEQKPEALEVFRSRTKETKSSLLYLPDYLEINKIHLSLSGTIFSLIIKGDSNSSPLVLNNLYSPMHGKIQVLNAALAILAVRTAIGNIDEEAIREGLSKFCLPARFELISKKPVFVIDGAHTKRSMEICLSTFKSLYSKGGILVFGCAEGKDIYSMAKLCVPLFSKVFITTPGMFKKSSPEKIFKAFCTHAEIQKRKALPIPEITYIPNTEEAIEKAIKIALESSLPILGTGSFYLAGEIRKKFNTL